MKDVAAGDARLAAAAQLRQMLEPRSAHPSGAARPTGLEPRDEAFARHLAYGVLRWYNALEWLAGRLLEKPLKQRDSDIRNLILIGLFQLWQGDCAPHAGRAR